MASPATFEKLGDLRKKYPGNELAQNYALTSQVPRMDRGGHSEGGGDGGGLGGGERGNPLEKAKARETCAVEAAIVVARHILAAVGDRYRQIKDGNPLACMIWADLDDPEGFSQHHEAKEAILRHFLAKPHVTGVSFYNLMESQEMLDTFWSLPAFQLWHPDVMARKEGSEVWEKAEIEDPAVLTREGLIKYYGDRDLGDRIGESFGTFIDKDTRLIQHWHSNEPVVIRVFFSNLNINGARPKTWEDLREINVKSHHFAKSESGKEGYVKLKYDGTGGASKTYILLAAVRLGAWKDENDLVRLYQADGENIPLPNDVGYRGPEWRLGDPGEKYLLYYRLSPFPPLVGGSGFEIAELPTRLNRKLDNIESMSTMRPPDNLADDGPAPTPAQGVNKLPLGPRSTLASSGPRASTVGLQPSDGGPAPRADGFLYSPPRGPRAQTAGPSGGSGAQQHPSQSQGGRDIRNHSRSRSRGRGRRGGRLTHK
ncbi:hypothetical protein F4815DRAFT_499237 [Daldinia loculata]|nr:hypothetical protein F4815DRAFT_499237 [Daldinia loculata]